MAQTYTIPDARTAVIAREGAGFNMPWFLFLNALFGSTGSGAATGIHTVLHGGGAGFGSVDLVQDTVGTAAVSQVLITQSSTAAAYVTVSGDGILVSSGKLTVSGTNGVAFAASATHDTTNASNISSGTISNARLGGISVTITTAMLTPGGATGSMTFTNGLLTAQTPAT